MQHQGKSRTEDTQTIQGKSSENKREVTPGRKNAETIFTFQGSSEGVNDLVSKLKDLYK